MADDRQRGAVDPDVGHRRLQDLVPEVWPVEDGDLFDRIGGQATVDVLVDSLYDRFQADRMIRLFFGGDLTASRARQKRFFAEWLGGPCRYSESAWGGLVQHHEDLPITGAAAGRWLDHLRGALGDAVPDEAEAARILQRARAVAAALVNTEDEPGGRGPAAAKHRSAQVASCGVGARTVKQAAQLAQRGKRDELAGLIAEVPDLVERTPFAAKLVHAAVLAGRTAMVDWLLDRGADANTPWPLDVRMAGGAMELVLFISPLCAAQMARSADVAALLGRRGAKEDIFTAAFLGDVPLAERMLRERPSLAQVADPACDVVTITPVHHAVAANGLATVTALLEHSTEPVRTGSRALRAAAQRANRPMIELLLAHGADARAVGAGRWVLHPEIGPLLARAGASAGTGIGGEDSGDWVRVSCTGNQGRKDDPAYVAALLRYGARVDQHYNGATALHYAAKAGFLGTIQLLREHGATADDLDARGRTPVDWLAQAAKSVDQQAVRNALTEPRR